MKLAWQNIVHDPARFLVTILGIAFAVFLMVFQGSLLCGFLRASAKLIESTDSDLWLMARGVVCFDFPAAIPRRFLDLARGVSGVEHASLLITAFAQYRKPDGQHQPVALIGADADVGANFPIPRLAGSGVVLPDSVVIDGSSVALLDVGSAPVEIEINHLRARVVGKTSGFSSFLGSPYVFTNYVDSTRYLGVSMDQTMYILLRVRNGTSAASVKRALAVRLPEIDIRTRAEFARRSQKYWLTQTGAGGGILTAAILGFLIGLVVVSQTMYATTMENLEEFATLKALGASKQFIVGVVLVQALVFGTLGCALGLAGTFPLVGAARHLIPWMYTPWWLPVLTVPPSLAMCGLAAVVSIRTALSVEPARVFRA